MRPAILDACRHCGKTIEFVPELNYYFHVSTQSVYCDLGGELHAEPAK